MNWWLNPFTEKHWWKNWNAFRFAYTLLRSQKLEKVWGLRGRYPKRVTSPSPFFLLYAFKIWVIKGVNTRVRSSLIPSGVFLKIFQCVIPPAFLGGPNRLYWNQMLHLATKKITECMSLKTTNRWQHHWLHSHLLYCVTPVVRRKVPKGLSCFSFTYILCQATCVSRFPYGYGLTLD